MVAAGELSIPASNAVFGDPTPNVVKRLRVEYVLDGKPVQKTVGENEMLELAEEREETAPSFEVARTRDGAVALTPWQEGLYTARTAHGRTRAVPVRESARTADRCGPVGVAVPRRLGRARPGAA